MKKLLISIVIITGLIFALITASVSITDFSRVYQDFTKSARIDMPAMEKSKFRIKKFPIPYIIIDEINQKDNIKLKNIEVHFTPLSLLMFDPKIAEIKIESAIKYINHDDVNFLTHHEFIAELISEGALSLQAKIGRLTFIESDGDSPLEIEDFIYESADGITHFHGKIDKSSHITGSFAQSGDEVMFKLNMDDYHYNVSIEEKYKNAALESGKVKIVTDRLSTNLSNLIPDVNKIAHMLSSSENVTITFDIKPTQNHTEFKNILITSSFLSGKGEAILSTDVKHASVVDFSFDQIDLAAWSKDRAPEMKSKDNRGEEEHHHTIYRKFDFNHNLKLNITANSVKLNEHSTLSKVNIAANIGEGALLIEDFSGKIDQEGKFNITGGVVQNSFRSLFNGKIKLHHKDLNDFAELFYGKESLAKNAIPFYLSSDIKLSSVDLSLRNLLLKTNEAEMIGHISTKFIGNNTRTNATVKFSSMSLDDNNFPVMPGMLQKFISFADGMKKPDYLSKFTPIRQINSISNYDLSFDKLTYNGRLYENVRFNLELSPSRASLEQLVIHSGDEFIDTTLTLETNDIKPTLTITIHNAYARANFLSAPSLLALKNRILEHFDLSKINIIMDCSFKKLYDDNVVLEKVLFQAKSNKNLLRISKFSANLFGGRLQSSGSILLEPYTLNFVYALNSAQIDEIAKLFPKNFLNIGGIMSANGAWSTRGEKPNQLLYNFYTKSDIIAKNIKINNFSIDDFVKKINLPSYNRANLSKDIKKALLTGSTTILDLKTSVEMTKGILKTTSAAFKTNYSAGSSAALFNIYDFNLDSSSIFSFYLTAPKNSSASNAEPTQIGITAKGQLFSPKKEATYNKLEKALKAR
ncbi:MAG: hypothetical protein COA94_01940 [Rickettsiales bacterium]|nr:MAG: hypothetical protein COA94_01940 [Rickettsiales bacterium]